MCSARAWSMAKDPKTGIEEREADIERILAIQADAFLAAAQLAKETGKGTKSADYRLGCNDACRVINEAAATLAKS